MYETLMDVLAKEFKEDKTISLVCQRTKQTGNVELCYFNKTSCAAIQHRIKPFKFVFGDYVWELDGKAWLKEDMYKKMKLCSIHMRGSTESATNPHKNRFLIGNTFLKNFYSVYDFDHRSVRMGVHV